MMTQRREIIDDLQQRKTREAVRDAAADGLVPPSTRLTHAVLNAHSQPMTAKKVAIIKRKPIQPPTETSCRDVDSGAEPSGVPSQSELGDVERNLPSPLRSKASTGPKPSLPDLPLPALEVPKSPPKKETKKKLKIIAIDNATGIITTADGWKLRAKMIKVKTEDGGERVVKKYVKVDDLGLQQLMPSEQQSLKRSAPPTQSNDLPAASQSNPNASTNVKLQRTIASCSTAALPSIDKANKQPLSQRFNRLHRPTADSVEAPTEMRTCFVILSNLGETINDLKIKDLCNRVGPIFSIQYRKSEGRALVKFKKPEDARAFFNQYNSRIFENQRINVHLRSPTRR